MGSSIGFSDVYDSMNIHLGEIFRNSFEMPVYSGQAVVIVDKSSNNLDSIKFNQVMDKLSYRRSRFYTKQHAGETVFEETLENLNIPLEVRGRQKTVYIHPPPAEVPFETFLPGFDESLQRTVNLRKKLERCYNDIEKSLRGKKVYSYKRKEKIEDGQRDLPSFNRGQIQLDNFFTKQQITRKSRSESWRKIRFDMIFRMPETPAFLLAELKAFPTVANREVENRTNQLLSYSAWLETKEDPDENLTPLLYISPTIISHREFGMTNVVRSSCERDVIPVCLTSRRYLSEDIKARKKKVENVLRFSTEHEMNPDVVTSYRLENLHLEDVEKEFKEFLE